MGRYAEGRGAPGFGGGTLRNFAVPMRRRFHTMLKRLLSTLFFVGAVFGVTSVANAQYMHRVAPE